MNTKTNFQINCLKIQVSLAAEDWDESQVNRDKSGRFASKNETSSTNKDSSENNSTEEKNKESTKEASDEDNNSSNNIKEIMESFDAETEMKNAKDFMNESLQTLEGEAKKSFDQLVNSDLYKSIKNTSMKEAMNKTSESYKEKLNMISNEVSKNIEKFKEENDINIGQVMEESISQVSKNVKRNAKDQMETIKGGIAYAGSLSLSGFLAENVMPFASKLSLGEVDLDSILSSSISADIKENMKEDKNPDDTIKNIEKLSNKGKGASSKLKSSADTIKKVNNTKDSNKDKASSKNKFEKISSEIRKEIINKADKLREISQEATKVKKKEIAKIIGDVENELDNVMSMVKKEYQDITPKINNTKENLKSNISNLTKEMNSIFKNFRNSKVDATEDSEEES